MATVMSDLGFNGMSVLFSLRDFFIPRKRILEEAGLVLGDHVLDYGCGPGGYVADTADIVGEMGQVYALDVHPLAIARVENLAARRGLTNVKTIRSDCRTGLPRESLDVVLMYDVFHGLEKPQAVLAEMHRVLKPDGILSFSDHHMSEEEIVAGVTDCRLFTLAEKGARTYTFMPRRTWEAASNE